MTNLAYRQQSAVQTNASYPDFAQHAKMAALRRYRRTIAAQHRYGFVLTLACLVTTLLAMAVSAEAVEFTGAVVLLPLGIFLMLTKKAVFYPPCK